MIALLSPNLYLKRLAASGPNLSIPGVHMDSMLSKPISATKSASSGDCHACGELYGFAAEVPWIRCRMQILASYDE